MWHPLVSEAIIGLQDSETEGPWNVVSRLVRVSVEKINKRRFCMAAMLTPPHWNIFGPGRLLIYGP